MSFLPSQLIVVKRVHRKGLGVHARVDIPEGTIIERAPVLLVPAREVCDPDGETRLSRYCFAWGDGRVGFALGCGSLYNHSYDPNARYDDRPPATKVFTAIRDIRAGEEITVNYGGSPDSDAPVPFPVT